MTTEHVHVADSVHYIREHGGRSSDVALILGSGLGGFADSLHFSCSLSTSEIPHYPLSTVKGHRGRLVFADLAGKRVVVFQGRVHFYESNSVASTLYPVQIAHALGVSTLIVTNAAGGVNRGFTPGDLMLITDQINMSGHRVQRSQRFHQPLYTQSLIQAAREAGKTLGIPIKSGVYVGLKGPTYETAAEVEMITRIGADAAGMSTVLEAEAASGFGMKLLGISCITNYGTGISTAKLNHVEVTEVGNRVKATFGSLLTELIKRI
jgi:purine-nucleoside phosphorylase